MKSRKSSLICLTGIDGSGKTTHAKSLVNFLSKEGYTVVYAWGASRPVLSLAFFGVTRILGYWKTTKKGMYTDPLEFAPSETRSIMGRVWRFFQFVDFQIKTLTTIRVHLFRGAVVVCDRYVYDMIMEFKVSGLSTSSFESLLLKTVPIPTRTLLLDVPEQTARLRRSIPAEELWTRRSVFLQMAKAYGFVVIDASKDFESNRSRIQASVMLQLRRND